MCSTRLGCPDWSPIRSLRKSQSRRCRSPDPQTGHRTSARSRRPNGTNSRRKFSQIGQYRALPAYRCLRTTRFALRADSRKSSFIPTPVSSLCSSPSAPKRRSAARAEGLVWVASLPVSALQPKASFPESPWQLHSEKAGLLRWLRPRLPEEADPSKGPKT